jgi:hypothetical protein
MYLVTVLYGDGSSESHLANTAMDARIWEAAYAADAWQVFINPLTRSLSAPACGLEKSHLPAGSQNGDAGKN